jgi:hypothetical protein
MGKSIPRPDEFLSQDTHVLRGFQPLKIDIIAG